MVEKGIDTILFQRPDGIGREGGPKFSFDSLPARYSLPMNYLIFIPFSIPDMVYESIYIQANSCLKSGQGFAFNIHHFDIRSLRLNKFNGSVNYAISMSGFRTYR